MRERYAACFSVPQPLRVCIRTVQGRVQCWAATGESRRCLAHGRMDAMWAGRVACRGRLPRCGASASPPSVLYHTCGDAAGLGVSTTVDDAVVAAVVAMTQWHMSPFVPAPASWPLSPHGGGPGACCMHPHVCRTSCRRHQLRLTGTYPWSWFAMRNSRELHPPSVLPRTWFPCMHACTSALHACMQPTAVAPARTCGCCTAVQDAGLHDALIDDVLSIVTTITGMCGVTLTVEASGTHRTALLPPDGVLAWQRRGGRVGLHRQLPWVWHSAAATAAAARSDRL